MFEELLWNPFVLDVLYKDIYFYKSDWSYIEKYLYYRSTNYKIDADVSLSLCTLYKEIYDYIDANSVIRKQKNNVKEICMRLYQIIVVLEAKLWLMGWS